MKERGTAIALLVIFLLGLVLAFVSLGMKNNVLGGIALVFILAGVVGNFALRRDREKRETAHKAEEEAATKDDESP